jgi:hypothetical protein
MLLEWNGTVKSKLRVERTEGPPTPLHWSQYESSS